jgi:hypothetical protein
MENIDFAGRARRLYSPQREMAQAAIDWGYGTSHINNRPFLWQNRIVLDIGMGGGPHCIPFVIGGACGYVGVDPLVGTSHVRDRRGHARTTGSRYRAFPYSTDEIMAAFPNVHLYSSTMEDASGLVKNHAPELITLVSVTEHLRDLASVIRTAYEVSAANCVIWISHANYYSWTGHHRPPRTVDEWEQEGTDLHRVTDWGHLLPDHPCYLNSNLNRVRLKDFRDLIEKYFEIQEWRVSIAALDRLSPELRQRWKKYTLEELLGRTIFVCGVRRNTPLEISLEDRQFHHPAEDYMADADHSGEDFTPFIESNLAYFTDTTRLMPHSYNKQRAGRIMAELGPGHRLILAKFPRTIELMVNSVKRMSNGVAWIRFEGEIPEDILRCDKDEWAIQSVMRDFSQTSSPRAPQIRCAL